MAGREAIPVDGATTGTAPQEAARPASFREEVLRILGNPNEVTVVWSSIEANGNLHEIAHLRIAPAFEIAPATAELSALVRPAVDDASDFLSQGFIQSPDIMPRFPTVPEELGFADLAKLSPNALAKRRRDEQATLKQGLTYFMAISELMHMPDAKVLDITLGSENNLPVESFHVSPTEIRATVGMWPNYQLDTRTISGQILGDGSVDLCLTDTKDCESKQKGGIEALIESKQAIESIFRGVTFRRAEQTTEPTPATPGR